MTTSIPRAAIQQGALLTQRYEELRASVLGSSAAPRWGLPVLQRQGLVRWMLAINDELFGAGRRPTPNTLAVAGLEAAEIRANQSEIVPMIAQMVAARWAGSWTS